MKVDTRNALKTIEKQLATMQRKGTDLRPIFRNNKKQLKEAMRANMARQNDSSGKRWKRTKPFPGRDTSKTLGQKLVSASKISFSKNHIEIKSTLPWTGIHQEGGTAYRGAKIPKREFFYASKSFLNILAKSIVKYIAGNKR